jgi:hypothetical protein
MFEANHGQTDRQVKFLSRGSGYTLFLTPTEAVLALRGRETVTRSSSTSPRPTEGESQGVGATLRMQFAGANAEATMTALDKLPGIVNYFTGKDPAKWRTHIPTYQKVAYTNVYPGIDLVYYGTQRQLEYDLVVHPGADANQIALCFQGADRLEVDAWGDLVLHTALGQIRQRKPVIYQEVGGVRKEVPGGYVLKGPQQVGFQVAAYDLSQPLVIDPEVTFSTFLGGTANEESFGIAVGGRHVFVTGSTRSLNFPTTPGAYDDSKVAFDDDVFVSKLSADGSELVFSTFLGGAGSDVGEDVALDAAHAYVVGETESTNFPTTPGAFDRDFNGVEDAFVTKLDADGGDLVYSTYLGGSLQDQARGVDVSGGQAYVTGVTFSAGFPTTSGAFDDTHNGLADAFVTNFNARGSALQYSTFLGGTMSDVGRAISVRGGHAYIAGFTDSTNFPTSPDAFDTTLNVTRDVFATKLDVRGNLDYSTYLGGALQDEAFGIAVDDHGEAYVTGTTVCTPLLLTNFPTTPGAYDTLCNGLSDAFVAKLNKDGTAVIYSTFLGGSGEETGRGIDVSSGIAYVAGSTNSLLDDYPTTPDAFQPTYNGGSSDAFVTELNEDGSALVYSTYLGGGARDQARAIAVHGKDAYVTGFTMSLDFPTTPGAYDEDFNGNRDVFITRFDLKRN